MYNNLPVFILLVASLAFAQKPGSPSKSSPRRSVDFKRTVRLQYSEPQWNKSKTQIDTASVIVKDPTSGKMVRIHLAETEVDSGVFSGIYNISWKEVQASNPEIYAVPPDKENAKIDVSKLNQLKRLPYIFKSEEKEQLIEAFSTREQATQALEAYRAQQAKKLKESEEISKALIETAEKSKKQALEDQRLAEVRRQEELRLQALSALERDIELRRAEFAKLSPHEQEKRKLDAKKIGDAAMSLYQNKQYPQAEERFKRSYQLDPTNDTTFYFYGATLYNLNKYSDSLVYLEFAKKGNFNPLERDFFKGLNHYRLEEHEKALAKFADIKKTKDQNFAPTSAFYEGLTKLKMEKLDEAKDHFQEVLDTSNDANLDQAAEDYIEKIEKMKAFLELKSKKVFITATVGLQYDSNVLLVNASSPTAGDPSRVGDYRYVTGAGVEYRPLYLENHEFSLKTKADLIYSSKGDNVFADPLIYSIKAPYKYKGRLWGKGYKFEAIPGYEMLYLDEDRSGATEGFLKAWREKDDYLKSMTADLLNSWIMSEDHIMGVNLKYRNDRSESKTATGDSDPTATKWTLEWQNIFFLNQKKNLGVIGTLGTTMNKADGKNLTYNRYDLSAMALFPAFWDFQGMGGLSYFLSNYPDRTPSRSDNNITANISLTRPLSPWLNLSVTGSYINNQSTVETSTYNKYLFMSVLTANWSL